MVKYSFNEITGINGLQSIFKLKIDKRCQFDEFENEVIAQGQYIDEISSIYALMEDVANNKLLPKTKFRDITINKKDKNKEYEFKTKHLRVYAIKTSAGKIIMLGGYKNTQKKDIARFRNIKKTFLQNQ
ncbi:MAG: hypothetical protein RBR97_01830 [Bacteroidales bacterium]|nr:hypothetical protein [Bacteroidales bacterium]